MDHDRFDRIARALGAGATRRAGIRAALGAMGLLGAATGLGLGPDAPDADARGNRGKRRDDRPGAAKRRKHQCGADKPCPTGFSCVRQGRKRVCACSSGVVCDGACCPAGQVCRNGACADGPEPGQCIAAGEPCKNIGRPCCDGRTCSSGQGGEADIACYVPKRGACARTADCIFGTTCQDGVCAGPVPLGGECRAGDTCIQGTCLAYRSGTPAGDHCLMRDGEGCSGDAQCVSQFCDAGVCRTPDGPVAVDTGVPCGSSNNGAVCRDTEHDTCTTYQDPNRAGTYCLRQVDAPCDRNADCTTLTCTGDVCAPQTDPPPSTVTTGLPCGDSNAGATCAATATDTCTTYDDPNRAGTYCLRQVGAQCTVNAWCKTLACVSGTCGNLVATGSACTANDRCADVRATCRAYDNGWPTAGTFCLLPLGQACAAADQCACNGCFGGVCEAPCDVCDSGCRYATVQAAITAAADGDIIRIGPGTYTDTVAVISDKSLTLTNCKGGARPLLQANAGSKIIDATTTATPRSLTLTDLAFSGSNGTPLEISGAANARMTFTMDRCDMDFSDGTFPLFTIEPHVTSRIRNSTLTNVLVFQRGQSTATVPYPDSLDVIGCTLKGLGPSNPRDVRGIDVAYLTLTVTDTQITDFVCINPDFSGGGIKAGGSPQSEWGATVILKGATRIARNVVGSNASLAGGGGVYVYTGSLAIEPTVQITQNEAVVNRGAGIFNRGTATITGATPTTVTGNFDRGTTTVTPGNQCTNGTTSCIT